MGWLDYLAVGLFELFELNERFEIVSVTNVDVCLAFVPLESVHI